MARKKQKPLVKPDKSNPKKQKHLEGLTFEEKYMIELIAQIFVDSVLKESQ